MRTTLFLFQGKRMTANAFLASAGKTGSEEKYAQAAMEYLYERVQANDPYKKSVDVEGERDIANAFDRFSASNEAVFNQRLSKLIQRSIEALEAIPTEDLLDEAVLLNSEQPPLNFHRPALTPPIRDYHPGYGIDVPQLRVDVQEYPKVIRPTDKLEYDNIEFGRYKPKAADDESDNLLIERKGHDTFPFVDANDFQGFTKEYADKLEDLHGVIRKEVPMTGMEGECWEAYMALNKKAVARQDLIFDLMSDDELREKYDEDETFRKETLLSRGITPLTVEGDEVFCIIGERVPPEEVPERHYSQDPKYEPFRRM
eukprot:Tbor_TRINITY_DN6127_c0_g1::TRINITY_DN6127_c0_g1_i1::g.21918::m.21918